MRSLLYYIALGLLFSETLWASKVIEVDLENNLVQITQNEKNPWETKDKICVYRKEKKIGCGRVIWTTTKIAAVEMDELNSSYPSQSERRNAEESVIEIIFGKEPIHRGDQVISKEGGQKAFVATKPQAEEEEKTFFETNDDPTTRIVIEGLQNVQRMPSSIQNIIENGKEDLLTEIEVPEEDERLLHHDMITNVSFGINFLFPTFQLQQAITRRFATGLSALAINAPIGDARLSGVGGYFTLNYFSLEPFHGSYLQMGGGFFNLKGSTTTQEASIQCPAVMLNAGYRWFWESGANFGFTVGGQYLITRFPDTTQINFSGFLPSIALDIGIAF